MRSMTLLPGGGRETNDEDDEDDADDAGGGEDDEDGGTEGSGEKEKEGDGALKEARWQTHGTHRPCPTMCAAWSA
jgi:hypothetical protein